MYSVISTLPYDSPLLRQQHGKNWHWYGPLTDLLAGVYDTMGVISATQAQRPKWKRSEVPKPIVRPWDVLTEIKKLGGKPRPLREIQKRLGWITEE